jgi:hypothetical protein
MIMLKSRSQRIILLTLAFSVAGAACIFLFDAARAEEAVKAGVTPKELVGSWKQVIAIVGKEVRPPKQDGTEVKLLHLTPTHFTRIVYNPKSKQLYGFVGGSCSAADGKYQENIDYADEGSRKAAEGHKPMQFSYKIENGQLQLKLIDPGSEYTEIWARVE